MSGPISGFSARSIPFHSLPSAKVVKDAPTVEDAIKLADLDWAVELEPVYHKQVDETFVPVKDRFLTVRQDTQQVLGSVGKNYRTFQNEDAFDFANELLGMGVEFDAAGHYDDSKKVFLTAKLQNGITVLGEDKLDLFLLFKTSHDGSSAISAMITPVRLKCTNMMNLASREAVSKWSARHTANAKDKLEQAVETLRLVDAYRVEFAAIAAQLNDVEVSLEGYESLIKQVTPAERLHKGMVNNWNNSPTHGHSTGWDAVNSIGEFLEHERGGRGNVETRFDSNLDGQVAAIRNRAVRLLLAR
jgi:phage/plasmid-like protein (TIGR03299 family)